MVARLAGARLALCSKIRRSGKGNNIECVGEWSRREEQLAGIRGLLVEPRRGDDERGLARRLPGRLLHRASGWQVLVGNRVPNTVHWRVGSPRLMARVASAQRLLEGVGALHRVFSEQRGCFCFLGLRDRQRLMYGKHLLFLTREKNVEKTRKLA